jgi:glycerophosphoryl diester phosphodiesterase
MAAFAMALAQGADGVELDVRPCLDDEVVVFHDPDLARMAHDPRPVSAFAYAALRAFDLGGGERVPRLGDALDLVLGAHKFVNVEIKRDVPDLDRSVDAVARVLGARSVQERERLIVSSFERSAIERLATHLPDVAVALLFSDPADPAPALEPGWHAHPRHTLVTPEALARWQGEGRIVNAWTVNHAEEVVRLAEAGLDGILTDDVPLVFTALPAGRVATLAGG